MNPSQPTADNGQPPSSPPPPTAATVQVGPKAVARIAAHYTQRVPGVLSLQPDLPQYLTNIAHQMLSRRPSGSTDFAADSVTVDIDTATGRADVSITVITRLGFNCLTIAEAIQHDVAEQIFAQTHLSARVVVTIADIAPDTRPIPEPAPA